MTCRTVALAAGLVGLLASPMASQETKGLNQVTGVWALASTQDVKNVDRGDDSCRMHIQPNGVVVLKIGELTTNSGKVTAGGTEKARQLDFKFKTGIVLGLYERKGDSLVICCDHEANGRPKTLRPEGTQWRETWKLVKVRQAPCIQP